MGAWWGIGASAPMVPPAMRDARPTMHCDNGQHNRVFNQINKIKLTSICHLSRGRKKIAARKKEINSRVCTAEAQHGCTNTLIQK